MGKKFTPVIQPFGDGSDGGTKFCGYVYDHNGLIVASGHTYSSAWTLKNEKGTAFDQAVAAVNEAVNTHL